MKIITSQWLSTRSFYTNKMIASKNYANLIKESMFTFDLEQKIL